jgi:hypothetical protein
MYIYISLSLSFLRVKIFLFWWMTLMTPLPSRLRPLFTKAVSRIFAKLLPNISFKSLTLMHNTSVLGPDPGRTRRKRGVCSMEKQAVQRGNVVFYHIYGSIFLPDLSGEMKILVY